ncbi:hypothetical protein C1141_14215 [Vibrio agarivorans]|nr:hypothetical protein C1141_14215 [Vibrio agarivorans]
MNSNIRFIASSKLSQAELPFVLTPDECIEQFSRIRNPNDILKSLPNALAQRISLSAKKSTTGLLQSMQTELAKVEWIAISLSPRRGGMGDSQLSRYPKLKAYIDSVIFTGKARTRKAGYQPVVDDVVLTREYVYVPSEPSPEHKIVVEFAGQWSSNAACLLLSKTENQYEKITVAKADKENQHRSLATFKDLEQEDKTLYIKIPCVDQPMPILLKLAEGLQPVEKETKMDEWDNVLIPVRPLAYLDEQQDKAKVSDLCGGFLYVFWQGKLWREMAINEKGFYQDIDVEYYRFRYKEEMQKQQPKHITRIANGFVMAHFWAPYKIKGEVQQGESGLKIIFSPKQKTFKQIEDLESDQALLDKASTPLDELSSYSDSQSFSTQQFTSDVDSAVIHSVTEEDMPWLTDKDTIVRSYDSSNTVIAYVDGQNSGCLVRLQVGETENIEDLKHYQGLTALMTDSDSDWSSSEPFILNQKEGYISAQIAGIPPKGCFSLVLAHSEGKDSANHIFKDLSYQELFNDSIECKAASAFMPTQVDEALKSQLEAENELLDTMKQLIFG